MTFGEIHRGKYKRRRVAQFNDSSDLAKAGYGVNVRLMKRDAPRATETRPWNGVGQLGDRGYRYIVQKEDTSMHEHSLVRVAKGLGQAVEKGLDGVTFAKLETQLAVEMYPDAPSDGHALAKLHGSNVGREMLHKAVQANYERLQYMSRCGDADVVMQKAEGNVPHVHHAQASQQEHTTSDPDDIEESYDKKWKRLTAAGFSGDEAHSMLHRAERLRKGF
jgi:hypothetical protein